MAAVRAAAHAAAVAANPGRTIPFQGAGAVANRMGKPDTPPEALAAACSKYLFDRPKNPNQLKGIVVGTAMQGTCKVRVAFPRLHPVVEKRYFKHKNIMAHDPLEAGTVGDWVQIEQCKQVSKRKSFRLKEILHPAQTFRDETGKLHTQPTKSYTDIYPLHPFEQMKPE